MAGRVEGMRRAEERDEAERRDEERDGKEGTGGMKRGKAITRDNSRAGLAVRQHHSKPAQLR
jgi:hypothetical protein